MYEDRRHAFSSLCFSSTRLPFLLEIFLPPFRPSSFFPLLSLFFLFSSFFFVSFRSILSHARVCVSGVCTLLRCNIEARKSSEVEKLSKRERERDRERDVSGWRMHKIVYIRVNARHLAGWRGRRHGVRTNGRNERTVFASVRVRLGRPSYKSAMLIGLSSSRR